MVVEPAVTLDDFFSAENLDHAALPAIRREVWSSPATMKDFKERTNEFAEAVAAMRNPAKIRDESFRLGCAYWVLARYDEAVAALEEVKTRREALWLIGKCHAAAERPAPALEAFGRAAGSGDADMELTLDLAAATRDAGDPEAAVKLLNPLKSDGETSADYQYQMARCMEAQGDCPQAVELYERAIELDPNCAKAAFRLAYMHDLYGDDDRALEYYEQCVEIEPKHTNALLSLGLLYEDMGESTKALKCFEQVLRAIPTHERAQIFYKDVKSYETQYYDETIEQKIGKRQAILDTPITDFELSVRSRNCLQKMNIHYLGDLTRITEEELLSYKNFGDTSLNEIKAILAQHAMRLGHAIQDGPPEGRVIDEDQPEEHATPVTELNFSSRCSRCLERLNVVTLGDLVARSEKDLLDCPNLGKTTLDEIHEKLGGMGLSLRDDTKE